MDIITRNKKIVQLARFEKISYRMSKVEKKLTSAIKRLGASKANKQAQLELAKEIIILSNDYHRFSNELENIISVAGSESRLNELGTNMITSARELKKSARSMVASTILSSFEEIDNFDVSDVDEDIVKIVNLRKVFNEITSVMKEVSNCLITDSVDVKNLEKNIEEMSEDEMTLKKLFDKCSHLLDKADAMALEVTVLYPGLKKVIYGELNNHITYYEKSKKPVDVEEIVRQSGADSVEGALANTIEGLCNRLEKLVLKK